MKLNRTERWIIANQMKILEKIDPDQREYYIQSQKILENGYEYLYEECCGYITTDDQIFSKEDSEHLLNILDMFRSISFSLNKLEDRTGINERSLVFVGFDGNEETDYYLFAEFYCTGLGHRRYPEIGEGDHNFNSHYPVLEVYERMLEVWNQCKDKRSLTKEELIQISMAGIHPENRE